MVELYHPVLTMPFDELVRIPIGCNDEQIKKKSGKNTGPVITIMYA